MFELIPEIRNLNTSVTYMGQTCLSSDVAERLVLWRKAGIAELLENEFLTHTGPTNIAEVLSPLRPFKNLGAKVEKTGSRRSPQMRTGFLEHRKVNFGCTCE
jgi:hypothetical protein